MLRKLIIITLACASFGIIGVIVIGGILAAPQQQKIGSPPADLPAVSVLIPRDNASPIAGWFIAGNTHEAGVLLLHSIRSNRREMIGRARFLHKSGYSVLLIDMQGHGETPGENITFGFRESRDAHVALEYLRSKIPNQPVGVIGVSLGGAATLLGKDPIQADAVILEAVYSSIDRAVENRMVIRFGPIGRYFAPLVLWQLKPRLGISTELLSPISVISNLKGPIMIIAGSDDRHTLLDESEKLFFNASEPKSLWIIPGAKHQNFYQFVPEDYERKVLEFFDKYLRNKGKKANPI